MSARKVDKKKDPKRQRAGRLAKTKGTKFEQKIARAYRGIYTGENDVRRGRQTHKADESDVVIVPLKLWTECQHAASPQPLKKLRQAERDSPDDYLALSITKGNRKPEVVALRFETLMQLTTGLDEESLLVKISLPDFLGLLMRKEDRGTGS